MVYRLLRPLLFSLDPELAHTTTLHTLSGMGPLATWMAGGCLGAPSPLLATSVGGVRWKSPIGLAAGLDKDGLLPHFWPKLGFGAVELGTVTQHPQPGNDKPRLFRFVREQALINRMGFNNAGSAALAHRLQQAGPVDAPLGINLGKSKKTPLLQAVADYQTSAALLAPLADYLVINVSSPNTPGLRNLQSANRLEEIVSAVVLEAQGVPVWVKLAPDLDTEALLEACAVAEGAGAQALIATNTTLSRRGLPAEAGQILGGLSGEPLRPMAQNTVRIIAEASSLPVIAAGGISSADHVEEVIRLGATAVQIYTGLVYHGPTLIHRIQADLLQRMEHLGCESWDAWVGQIRKKA